MTWVAAAVGVAGAAGSIMGANKQAGAGKEALRLQGDIYNANKAALDPWRNVGIQGLGALQQGLGIGTGFGSDYTMGGFNPNSPLLKGFTLADFQASPAYNFNLQQGQQAIHHVGLQGDDEPEPDGSVEAAARVLDSRADPA